MSPERLPLLALMHPSGADIAGGVAQHTWNLHPGVLLPLIAVVCLYAIGLMRLWRVAGIGAGVAPWRATAFTAGFMVLIVALVSPVDAIGAQLSSVHMVQHELLMIVAAPLLVTGLPLLVVLFVLPAASRRKVMATLRRPAARAGWAGLSAPTSVWLLHAAAIWGWHIPGPYEAALRVEWLHAVQHACFFGSALLFWWGMTRGRYGRMGYGAAVVYVFATTLHTGLLGAALTLSTTVWYESYAGTSLAWGLTPLEDQQLAGLIMWIPAGAVFTAMGLVYFAAWLRESERRTRFSRLASNTSRHVLPREE